MEYAGSACFSHTDWFATCAGGGIPAATGPKVRAAGGTQVTLLMLYLLALLDGLLCGLRASMGRCAVIRKRGYYRRAALFGAAGAQMISTLALVPLLADGANRSVPPDGAEALEGAARPAAWLLVPCDICGLF